MIFILFLTGCNVNENVENNILSGDIENQQQKVVDNIDSQLENLEKDVYLLKRSEETIEDVIYEIFENESVIVKLMHMDETHDYSPFSGESLYNQTSYFGSVEYGKVNLIEKDGKIMVELYSDSNIEYCILKDNKLSIVLQSPTYPGTQYNVLNVDIKSRKTLNADEFIKSLGKDIEQLKNEIKQIEYSLIKEFCKEVKGDDLTQELELYQSESYFEENFDFSKVVFYYNETGHISFNFETYFGIPGAGAAKYLYDLELGKVIERIFGY